MQTPERTKKGTEMNRIELDQIPDALLAASLWAWNAAMAYSFNNAPLPEKYYSVEKYWPMHKGQIVCHSQFTEYCESKGIEPKEPK